MNRRNLAFAVVIAWAAAFLSGCNGYLIDASTQGGLAFVAFTVMVFCFAGALFAMDRIREKHDDES